MTNDNWEQNAKDLAQARDRLYKELERLREENTLMRALLSEIAQNAPDDEPTSLTPKTLPTAWAFWVAGQRQERWGSDYPSKVQPLRLRPFVLYASTLQIAQMGYA